MVETKPSLVVLDASKAGFRRAPSAEVLDTPQPLVLDVPHGFAELNAPPGPNVKHGAGVLPEVDEEPNAFWVDAPKEDEPNGLVPQVVWAC